MLITVYDVALRWLCADYDVRCDWCLRLVFLIVLGLDWLGFCLLVLVLLFGFTLLLGVYLWLLYRLFVLFVLDLVQSGYSCVVVELWVLLYLFTDWFVAYCCFLIAIDVTCYG